MRREPAVDHLLRRRTAGLEIQHMTQSVGTDLDAVGLGGQGERAAGNLPRQLAGLFHKDGATVGPARGFQFDHPLRRFTRQRRLARQGVAGHAGLGQFGHVERFEDRSGIVGELSGMGQRELLERGVNGGAARAGLHLLVGTLQGIEAQDVARPDRIGITGQGLDPRDEKPVRTMFHGRLWRGAWIGSERLRRIQVSRPRQQLGPARDRHLGTPRQGFQTPQPTRLDRRRAFPALGVQQDHVGRAGGLREIMG